MTRMTDLNWESFRTRVPQETDLVLVPIGTIEAHGAIPLGTDNIIPTAMADDLAPRIDALVAPLIPYGVTNSLLPYPGSTTVTSATFEAYVFEACAGLVDTGFRRVVLLNGHGGQTREVHRVVNRLWSEKQAFAVAIEWWGVAAEPSQRIYGKTAGGHAGIEETAMVVAITPELIDDDRATTIRRVPRRPGVKARPFPASIILDREEQDDNGAPILDREQAGEFYNSIVDNVERVLLEIFDGWRELRG